jgi:hypothetical protein
MTRKTTGAWLTALGTSILMMSVHAYGAGQTSADQKPAAPKTPATTVTGCLRVEGNQFQLTNLKGSARHSGRSWKTGFVKKTAKNVEVVGASTNVKLIEHVGREVSVVGTRDDDTHLRASSIKRVATSCS